MINVTACMVCQLHVAIVREHEELPLGDAWGGRMEDVEGYG